MERSGLESRIRQIVTWGHAGTMAFIVMAMMAVPASAAEPAASSVPLTISPGEARQHVGTRVTVQFKVQHAKAATNPDRVYLDSETDYRHPENLGALIEAAALPAFQKAGIKKPAAHYNGKTIRVTGKVFLRDDNVFISLEKPEQVEIVKTTNSP